MPTANVYIDGFNLFYRCLKGTPYKWLDVARLSEHLLPKGTIVNRIRYFTARWGPDRTTRTRRRIKRSTCAPSERFRTSPSGSVTS
jgi:hypothetical protein